MTTRRRDWPILTGLILLSVVPTFGSALRVVALSGGAEVTPANERFFDAPVPVLLHIAAAVTFSLLGRSSSPRGSVGGTGPGTAGQAGCWSAVDSWWPRPGGG